MAGGLTAEDEDAVEAEFEELKKLEEGSGDIRYIDMPEVPEEEPEIGEFKVIGDIFNLFS